MSRLQFGIYQIPEKNEKGNQKKKSYARLISWETRKTEEICSYISDCCSLTAADIKGTLEALSQYIGDQLSQGRCVELDGLGIFSPALKTVDEKSNDKGETLYDVRVNGVNFRCSQKLKKEVQKAMPQKVKRGNITSLDHKTRSEKLQAYLKRHPSINLTTYQQLVGCTYYQAKKDFRLFEEEKLVCRMGRSTHCVYTACR